MNGSKSTARRNEREAASAVLPGASRDLSTCIRKEERSRVDAPSFLFRKPEGEERVRPTASGRKDVTNPKQESRKPHAGEPPRAATASTAGSSPDR